MKKKYVIRLGIMFIAGALLLCSCADKQKLVNEIPWDKIKSTQKNAAKYAAQNYTVYHPLKDLSFPGNEKIYNYLLNHLDITARIVTALGVDEFYAERLADGRIYGKDMYGVKAYVTELYREDNRRIYYVEGTYEGQTFKFLSGKAVMVWNFKNLPGGRIHNNAHIFVFVDQKALRAISKILRPFLGRMIERKLSSLVRITQTVSTEISKSAEDVYKTMIVPRNSKVKFTKEELDEFHKEFLEPQNK